MSYSNSFPTQRPTLNLDFANSGKLDSRISYARSSTGTALSSERHLSSENLLLQSQNFGTTWNVNATVASRSASSGTGPDGSDSWLQTAATSGSIWPSFNQSFGFKASTQYTYSIYLKAGTATHAWFAARGNAGNAVTGTLNFSSPGSIATTSVGGWTVNSSSVTAHGDWYRISITFTTNSTVSSPFVYVGLSDGTVPASYYPSGTPNGETVYVWGAQLEERGSATAYNSTTTQIHREYAPTLKTSAANEPRFEYTTDGESEGLLIEASATNLQRYGSDFASWSYGSAINRYSNQAIAPNGMLEADLLVGTDATSLHYFLDAVINFTAGLKYTMSVYFKDAGQRYVQLSALTTLQGSGAVNFDLQSGTLSASGAHTGTLESVGNGWYRATATITAAATVTSGFAIQSIDSLSSSRSSTSVCDGYSGWLAWGAQIETGSSASSLVDTGTGSSQLTRSADSCSVALSDIGITRGQDVTLVVEGDYGDPAINNNNRIAANLQDGINANYVFIYNGSSNAGTGYVRNDAADQAYFSSGITSGAFKSAISAKNNLINYAANGTAGTTDTAGSVPLFTVLRIGGYSSSGVELNGNLKRVSLFGQALSSTELAALTS